MNIRLVIVWFFAIIIFAGIGFFGMANQHLLNEPIVDPNSPGVDDPNSKTHTVSCMSTSGNSSYSFTIDDVTNNITSVSITYKATSQVDHIYASAVNLSNAYINGVTSSISGSANDFVLIMKVNPIQYDSATLANYQADLANVSAVIDKITDVETYKSAISTTGNEYNCN